MSQLVSFGPEIWTAEGPVVSFLGFPYPTRMAVLRLAGGELLVWSPIALDEPLTREVTALGRVAHLVSPNKLHHLYLSQWKHAFPQALMYASPGLAAKRRDLAFDAELTGEAPPAWRGQVDQAMFEGSPFLTEVVFFHRTSGTALFCDLIQNFRRDWFSGWRGWVARLDGIVAPDHGAPREWRASFLDRAAARRALNIVLDWQPRAVIIAHGDMAAGDGTAFICRAFGWLGAPRT
jgi:hypothetical protein